MPKFKIEFSRKVVCYDIIEREIEAESQEAADAMADQLADEFDTCCPDDCDTDRGGVECESWFVEHVVAGEEQEPAA